MAKPQIEPKILKGFRDHLPQEAIPRWKMIQTLSKVFESFGFVPIDTPAIEYTEILLGKGSQETDKQLYRFKDHGDRDVALRFDLTVPLARFAAMYIDQLGTPFKRYHIAPVWRGEKPQRGRYREFIQCDFDIIGTKSIFADTEIILLASSAFAALDIDYKIRLNNRLILSGLLETINAKDKTSSVLKAIDKLDKLGQEKVEAELTEEANLSTDQISQIFYFLSLSKNNAENSFILAELKQLLQNSSIGLTGIQQLEQILETIYATTDKTNNYAIDLSIARGLDYYTGTVFETRLTALPEIGSICGGGRYDNLANLYTNKDLPGVGAAIGLDRLLAAYQELGKLSNKPSTAFLLITLLDPGTEPQCFSLAQRLRNNGLNVELYPEVCKLGTQLKYANKKAINQVIIAGKQELESNSISIKNLVSGEQVDKISLEQSDQSLISVIKNL